MPYQNINAQVTAADVQLPPNLEIVSPEKPICSLSKGNARFETRISVVGAEVGGAVQASREH